MQGLGNCYRLKVRDTNCGNVEGGALLEREIIAQSINTGHDVANIQFDLQIGKIYYSSSRILAHDVLPPCRKWRNWCLQQLCWIQLVYVPWPIY